ncbi:thiopeptide-type bacteriocin biosynthesis protein [Cloacibacterium sp. TD35]|uniref:thiopeptide-type bacteriocin biosynthesis protein n=1 Tax=Cloacibacterium sp. TD35 TaxID=2976818 RepID=UPI00237E0FC1|nr:thiopeptide-type bacteriocin biosynthesis protein [Cloacibacterium sp. TD35]WDT67964.1 thiopeptide-type bacteriocin biosynthesis protein [Cloacibacterium sp. TD35]
MKRLNVYNIIGGEWIYYKIYVGTKSADDILNNTIFSFANEMIEKKIINHWFFIRYNDPKFHLRIRFNCDIKNLGSILVAMHGLLSPLIEEFIIWKVQIDTYNREIERYGLNTMEFSEKVFYYDTLMVSKFLYNFKDENLRWLFALKSIDSFLDLFKYELVEKINLMEILSTSFKNEIGTSKILNSNLSDKYRKNRTLIENAIEEKNENKDLYKIIYSRNINISNEPVFSNFNKLLEVPLNSFISSHIHMTMNRVFKSKNRIHEMVCYDFLCRYYKSKMAIERKNQC